MVILCRTWLQDKEPKGIIPLENIQVREVAGDRGKPNSFELFSASNDVIKACKTDSEGKVIEGQDDLLCTLVAARNGYTRNYIIHQAFATNLMLKVKNKLPSVEYDVSCAQVGVNWHFNLT